MIDLRPLLRPSSSKILLLVIDGLGGFADGKHGTELEEADTPNLDALAEEGIVGELEPVGPGITPGSGPGHLALFGYDPVEHLIGRGAFTAAGIGVELGAGDVAARGNLAGLDADGTISDRRAGRIDDEAAVAVVELLTDELGTEWGDEIEIHHVRGHRVLLVVRGDHHPGMTDTDPHRVGVEPGSVTATVDEARPTASLVSDALTRIEEILADSQGPVDTVLLRGFEGRCDLPSMRERFGVNPAAVADYPMYRGAATLVGMNVLQAPRSLSDLVEVTRAAWQDHDYFFLHVKETDSAGEDGDRDAKQAAIEAVDRIVPGIVDLGPDVLAVTGDHSTPSQLAAHSWHPVPALIHDGIERDHATAFGERWCRQGALGRRRSVELMPMLLAAAGRLDKFGP